MFLKHLAFCSLASLTASSGSVLLVDAASGPFFDIQSAVDASANGDVVLVRAGVYPEFAVVARSIAVAADTGANVFVQGAIRARNVGSGQTVVFSGLRSQGDLTDTTQRSGLRVSDCAGSIRVQNCEFSGGPASGCATGAPAEGMPAGAHVRTSPDVLIARSLIVGGQLPGGYYSSQPTDASGPGLEVESSRVALQQVVVRGPAGGSGNSSCPDGSSGGAGVLLRRNSQVDAQLTEIRGGNGGHGQPLGQFSYGGNGGSGLWFQNSCPAASASLARLLTCSIVPGSKGLGHCFIGCGLGQNDGFPGAPVIAAPCTSNTNLVGVAPVLDCAAVVRESTTLPITFTGAPLDRVWLRIAQKTSYEWVPAQNGVQLVDGAGRWIEVGEIRPSGQFLYSVPVPTLFVGEQSRVYHVQVLAQRPNGSLQIGFARSVIVVDSAF